MAKHDHPFIEATFKLYIPISEDLKDLANISLSDLLKQPSEVKVHKPSQKGKPNAKQQ